MLKKIRNNNGSALTTAILIMIVVATIGIITSLILSSNVRITLKRVNERMEIIRVENEMYNILSSYTSMPTETVREEKNINNKIYSLKVEKVETETNIFIFSISFENECIVKCEVEFSIIGEENKCYYVINSWSV